MGHRVTAKPDPYKDQFGAQTTRPHRWDDSAQIGPSPSRKGRAAARPAVMHCGGYSPQPIDSRGVGDFVSVIASAPLASGSARTGASAVRPAGCASFSIFASLSRFWRGDAKGAVADMRCVRLAPPRSEAAQKIGINARLATRTKMTWYGASESLRDGSASRTNQKTTHIRLKQNRTTRYHNFTVIPTTY